MCICAGGDGAGQEEQQGQKQKGAQVVTPATPAGKKQKIDANAPPCHGMAFHGLCKKGADCPYDHHAGRCAAYKKKHPDGVPKRE